MSKYIIKSYESGFEEEQAKIGLEVSKNWAWPFHYTLEELKEIYSENNFDPETQFSCFKDGKMIGFALVILKRESPAINIVEGMIACLDIPRVLSSHEEVPDLLMERLIAVLKAKGAKCIQTRVSTMRENSIQLAEKWGFSPHKDFPLGYKNYYYYHLSKGKLDYPTKDLQIFDPERDLTECIKGVSYWFKMSKERAKKWILEVDSRGDLVSHLVIRENEKLAAYCFAYPHPDRNDIVATYYIAATKEDYLKQLLVQTINNCIAKNHKYFLVDVMRDLLRYQSVVISLGFENVATWGIYELRLY
ncbi:MAG: hypothetical protein ACFFC7_05835 [Candidatus Hermodarchaeota archaeon]